MKVTKCDKCHKEIASSGGVSRLTSRQLCQVNVNADEYGLEPPRFEMQWRARTFDLCQDCAGELEKLITGYFPARKIL